MVVEEEEEEEEVVMQPATDDGYQESLWSCIAGPSLSIGSPPPIISDRTQREGDLFDIPNNQKPSFENTASTPRSDDIVCHWFVTGVSKKFFGIPQSSQFSPLNHQSDPRLAAKWSKFIQKFPKQKQIIM